jgi:uncharacterized membrane protein YecN with MAPEG domain
MPVMTNLQIAALYCALNAIVTLALAINAAVTRGRTKVLLGDGGNESMLRAMRAHANNIEYVPLTLVMLVTLALLQGSAILLHVIGAALFVGRAAHGYGLATHSGINAGRGIGTALTMLAMITAIVMLFIKALS